MWQYFNMKKGYVKKVETLKQSKNGFVSKVEN